MTYLKETIPYVYKVTVKNTGEYYYGYRKINHEPGHIDLPKYQTSSKKIKKIGFENCHWEIVDEFKGPNADVNAFDLEQDLIASNWGDPLMLNGSYRKRNGGKAFTNPGGWKHTKKWRDNHSRRMSGKHHPNFGRTGSLNPCYEQKRPHISKGKNHPSYDGTIYQWVHEDGRQETCTAYDLRNTYNLNQGNVSCVVNGRYKSSKGWSLKS